MAHGYIRILSVPFQTVHQAKITAKLDWSGDNLTLKVKTLNYPCNVFMKSLWQIIQINIACYRIPISVGWIGAVIVQQQNLQDKAVFQFI